MVEKIAIRKKRSVNIPNSRELGLLGFIIILSILIQIRNPRFLTVENINDLLKNTAILSILAVGMMLVIVTRGIDLSIGATLALSGMITALTVSTYPNIHPLFALLLGTIIGMICGSVVGLLISKANILPIIASLGMMNVYRGLTYMVSGGSWVSADQMPASFKNIATSSIFGVNTLVFIAIIIYLVFFYFISYTRTGRQIYAVGSNPDAAKISGIKISKILLMVYTIMGALAGLTGVLWVSKFASAQGDTATGYELTVIAACVLGGVNIAGGAGKISGVILGSLLLGILNNALPMINVSPFWQQAIQGLIILAAVIVNVLVTKRIELGNLIRREI
ncbi:ABC transporter permease [Thermoanaerobacter uzonensis]|jgi:rhamnose transport system permease protein|uniref:ABC transporter permease n=1 Tax=Thermoanaerobacter uzonensis TaxID=447593 RepID=UPI003D766C85